MLLHINAINTTYCHCSNSGGQWFTRLVYGAMIQSVESCKFMRPYDVTLI